MNLYEEDHSYLKAKFGNGFTEKVRDLIHRAVGNMKMKEQDNE